MTLAFNGFAYKRCLFVQAFIAINLIEPGLL